MPSLPSTIRFLALLSLLAVPRSALAQDPPAPAHAPPERASPLRIAVTGNAPFVIEERGVLRGISVDLWRAAAARLGVDYELERVPNAGAAVEGVATGRFDGAIGPLSITSERARAVDFTQPYWEATLGILTRPASAGPWERIRPFLSRAFAGALAVLLVVLTLVGGLLWFFERGANEQFPRAPAAGIGVGMWLALVTMTTVGYGDKAPVTLPGRVLAGVWMVLAMLTASSLTAGIATALTLAQLDRGAIETAGELAGRPVATLRGTTAQAFVERYGVRFVGAENVAGAVELLRDERVDAVVYDRPVLQYHLRRSEDLALRLSDEEYEPQGYGFAFPLGAALDHRVDVALLELAETGRVAAIAQEYL